MEIKEKYGRFKDAPWFNSTGVEENVIIGGAGGIGSWLALLLTRAGFMPIIYDFDKYEAHNVGGQLCKTSDIGKTKVAALKQTVFDYTGESIYIKEEKYEAGSMTHHFVFSGFDNMMARRVMFDNWRKEYKDDPKAIFIDGRLTFEQLQIFCVTPDRIEDYQRHLFDDSQVEEAPCTMKQTSHTAVMIAAHMTTFFTNYITNTKTGEKVRAVPFFWEYFCPIDLNTVEE